jgi:hypothetical protein
MKLAHTVSLVGLGLVTLGYVAVSQGCSSSSTPAGTTTLGAPPQKPNAPATTSKAEHNYALWELYLGDSDRTFAASTTAWKKYGYNIDGKVSTKDSTDVCTPAKGAGKDAQVDGDNGVDNAFGSRIVPIIKTFANDISKTISDSIKKGSFTIMLDVTGLDDTPTQTATGLTGKLYAGAAYKNGTPTFTPNDDWPVRPELLSNPSDAKTSKVTFGDAFVVNGTWVNGTGSDVTISLTFSGVALDITVHRATIVFDHHGAQADNGTIAGVINTQELIDGLRKVAGNISDSLCQGSAFDSIAQQIAQASDILTDGSNAAGKDCDAISIGIGFTAKEIKIPDQVGDPATGTNKCDATDGGTDSGGGEDSGGGQDSGGD